MMSTKNLVKPKNITSLGCITTLSSTYVMTYRDVQHLFLEGRQAGSSLT